MTTIFNVLQSKMTESIDELLENHMISNNKDSVRTLKKLSKDIITNSVSSHSVIELINSEPEILLMDLRNIPDTIDIFNSEQPNYLDSLKAFMSHALFNYSLEYLHRKGIFERDQEGNIVLKN